MADRLRNPPPIVLTDRDDAILASLYAHDGLLARRQIARLHFPGRDESRVKHRMRDLFDHRYVNQPHDSARSRVDEWVYWLDVKGYHHVANQQAREATKAELSRAKGFVWDSIPHMVAVNDVRLAILEAIERNPQLSLVTWKSQWALNRFRTDTFPYRLSRGKAEKGTYVADGFCIIRQSLPDRDKDRGYAYLLEIDRGNESQQRISEDKLQRGYYYLQSDAYKSRHGLKFGRFLIVTTGDKRMNNMRQKAAELDVARAFYFSTFARLGFEGSSESWRLTGHPASILTEPVWFMADSDRPFALIPLGA